ncbi:hypothetical protein [Chlamydia sp. 04-14]
MSTNFTTWAEKHSMVVSRFILIPNAVFVNRKSLHSRVFSPIV